MESSTTGFVSVSTNEPTSAENNDTSHPRTHVPPVALLAMLFAGTALLALVVVAASPSSPQHQSPVATQSKTRAYGATFVLQAMSARRAQQQYHRPRPIPHAVTRQSLIVKDAQATTRQVKMMEPIPQSSNKLPDQRKLSENIHNTNTNNFGSTPKDFECGGFSLTSPRVLANQGLNSITARYTMKAMSQVPLEGLDVGEEVVVKFSLPGNNDSQKRLHNELEIINHLTIAEVDNIIEVIFACSDEDGNLALVMPLVSGHGPVEVFQYEPLGELKLTFAYTDNEQELVTSLLSSVFGMIASGCVNVDQYHNLMVNDAKPSLTFYDFGNAEFLDSLSPTERANRVSRFLFSMFSLIPRSSHDFVDQLMSELAVWEEDPFPQNRVSIALFIETWDEGKCGNKSRSKVEEKWSQQYTKHKN